MIEPDGTLSNCGVYNLDDAKKNNRAKRRARQYANSFVDALIAGDVPVPSGGDCWYCCMKTEDGKALGDALKDGEHILAHVEEKYYVPSLLVNAIERFPVSIAARKYISACWNREQPHAEEYRNSSWSKGICYQQISKSIYRYVLEKTGFAG